MSRYQAIFAVGSEQYPSECLPNLGGFSIFVGPVLMSERKLVAKLLGKQFDDAPRRAKLLPAAHCSHPVNLALVCPLHAPPGLILQNISAATGVPYRDMLFFDDNDSNIRTVSKLGACCMRVNQESGLTFAAVQSGMKKYKEARLARLSLAAWLSPSPRNGAANEPDKSTVARPK